MTSDNMIDLELLAREICHAQQVLTEPSPENGRALHESRMTEAEQNPMSPELPRNKRRKTTTAIAEDVSKASEVKRRKTTNNYRLKGSSQADFEISGADGEKQQASKELEKGGRDLWEFPGSSALEDPLAPRRETGTARVKSRNAGGDTVNVEFDQKPDRNQSEPLKESFETHDTPVHDGKNTQSANSHGTDPLAGTSFRIDLTDPTLMLTASQKEQYQHMSTTASAAGSLPSPLPDEPSFVTLYGKISDASSTVPYSTPSIQIHNGALEISPFPGTMTSPDMSVHSLAMQTPSQASQTGSKSVHTARRAKSTLGLQSPDGDESTSSTSKKPKTSIPTPKPKRRSKTTMSVSSQYPAQDAIRGDLSLPATFLDPTNNPADKITRKRKAKDVDELGSDDIEIGLPKEQYKPRPSRSRGNTNLDELLESVDFSKRPEAQVKGKNKRRKTHESDASSITKEAGPTPESRLTGEGTTEKAVETTNPIAVVSDTVNLHDEDIVQTGNDKTLPPQKPVTVKRKPPTDDPTERGINNDTTNPQPEQKAPTNPAPKQPAPKARGRPRKKTEEKPLPIAIVDETLPESPNLPSQHLSQPNDKINPDPTPALEETDPNFNAAPNSSVQVSRPSTPHPPPPHTAASSGTPPPATPEQKVTDLQKGAQKHSPLNGGRVPYRVGLSRRARIEPLLRGFRK